MMKNRDTIDRILGCAQDMGISCYTSKSQISRLKVKQLQPSSTNQDTENIRHTRSTSKMINWQIISEYFQLRLWNE